MSSPSGLRPQDVVVLLKMAASKERSWRLIDLAQELGLSLSEVSMALERSRRARLLDSTKKKINWQAFSEFVVHGLKYAYPVEPGPLCRGVPTAHSAPPLSSEIVSNDEDQYVWPFGDGTVRGQAIEPLYSSVPQAALKDAALHQLLALVDALRVGRARERQIAAEELKRRLHAA